MELHRHSHFSSCRIFRFGTGGPLHKWLADTMPWTFCQEPHSSAACIHSSAQEANLPKFQVWPSDQQVDSPQDDIGLARDV